MVSPLAVRWHRLEGRPVRSLVAGTPRTGTPELVVVPGLGAVGYLLPTVRSCAQWTRVHLLDVPGFGHRATAGLPADLASTAATVQSWLAETTQEPVLLVGHSTGAQVAARAATARPDLVTGLVAAGITFPPELRRLLPLAAAAARTAVHESPGELPAVLPCYLRGAARMPVLLRTAMDDRPEEALRRLRRPLLVLRGRHDRLSPQPWAEQLARSAPVGRCVVLPGAHNTPWTHPAETSAALRGAC